MSGKLKEVKDRIESVKNTQKITKAMKLVAASKFKRATDAITQMRPYANKLSQMLSNIVTATEGDVKVDLAEERPSIDNVLIVVITSDKGLCGGFNTNVVKKAKQAIEEYDAQRKQGKLSVMTIGKKGMDALKRYKNVNFIDDHINLFKKLTFESATPAIEEVLESYTNGEYDKIVIAYSQFKNAITQIFHLKQFLPIEKLEIDETAKKTKVDYVFEPDKHQLIQELAPKILKTQFYSYLLDSNASEHGARMSAMDNATENANELLKDLKTTYNKERQAAITKELIEIVSGAAALGS